MLAAAVLGWFVLFPGNRARIVKPSRPPAQSRVVRPLVVVDPGHGGIDPGSVAGGVDEARVNLAVSRAIAKTLVRSGYRVLLTRSDGSCRPAVVGLPWARRARAASCRTNLRDRVLLAIHHHASVFLSIHADLYGDSSVRGPRTYYIEGSAVQQALAQEIQRELTPFRKAPIAPVPCQHFSLIALKQMPAVTIETGYLSNPGERQRLQDPIHQTALAAAITRGVGAFAKTHPLLPPPSIDAREIEREWQAKRGRLYRRYQAPGVGHIPAQTGEHDLGCV